MSSLGKAFKAGPNGSSLAACGVLRSSGPGAAFTLSLFGTSRAVGWRWPTGAGGMLPEGSVNCAKAAPGATSATATRRDRIGCLRPKALVVMTFSLRVILQWNHVTEGYMHARDDLITKIMICVSA